MKKPRMARDFSEAVGLTASSIWLAPLEVKLVVKFIRVFKGLHRLSLRLKKVQFLFYASTRGKKLVVLTGQKKALAIAVRNNKTEQRFSGLPARLVAKTA